MQNFTPETMITARALRTILPNYAKPNNRLFLLDTSGPRACGQSYSLVEQEWAEVGVQGDMDAGLAGLEVQGDGGGGDAQPGAEVQGEVAGGDGDLGRVGADRDRAGEGGVHVAQHVFEIGGRIMEQIKTTSQQVGNFAGGMLPIATLPDVVGGEIQIMDGIMS